MTKPSSWALAVAVVWVTSPAGADLDLSAFRYKHPINAASDHEEIAAVALDSEVWDGAASGATDLRVVTCHQEPVAHVLRHATRRVRHMREVPCESKVSELQELPENRIELRLTIASDKPSPDTIRVDTPLRDFERQLSVWGLAPDGTATPLVDGALIYDYARFVDLRHCEVALPTNTFRAFRLLIENVTDTTQSPRSVITRTFAGARETARTDQATVTTRPFRIDRLTCLAHEAVEDRQEPVMVTYTPAAWEVSEDGDDTVIAVETFDEPMTGFVLDTSARNFSRPVVVQVSASEGGVDIWREIGRGHISRIAFRTFTHDAMTVSFPERQARRFRLVIRNGDSAPLPITSVQGRGPQWEVLFLADPVHNHFLYYGGPAEPANYDTAAITRVLGRNFEPVAFSLAARGANPAFRRAAAQVKGFVGSRLFFVLVVVLMVGVIGFGLVKAGKQAVVEP